jgi:hypothetical protein
MVHYVPKSTLYPRFGFCNEAGEIFIGDWLPKCAQEFLIDHEMRHLLDHTRPDIQDTFTKEERGNITGFRKHWKGALVVLWISVMSIDRWKYYIDRFRGKET